MKPSPELLNAARALWDRGRQGGKGFDELSEHQRTDLIADSAAVLRSVLGHDRAVDRFVGGQVLGLDKSAIKIKSERAKKTL